MRSVLFDTSIYIPFLRDGKSLSPFLNPTSKIYLSSVVLEELYAGAQDAFTLRKLEDFYHTFKKFDRVLTPGEKDWIQCGPILSKIGMKYGFETIKKSRLVNDVLIALSCSNMKIILVTANLKDFKIIQEELSFKLGEDDRYF